MDDIHDVNARTVGRKVDLLALGNGGSSDQYHPLLRAWNWLKRIFGFGKELEQVQPGKVGLGGTFLWLSSSVCAWMGTDWSDHMLHLCGEYFPMVMDDIEFAVCLPVCLPLSVCLFGTYLLRNCWADVADILHDNYVPRSFVTAET